VAKTLLPQFRTPKGGFPFARNGGKPPEAATALEREPEADREEPNQKPRNVLAIPKSLWTDEKVACLRTFIDNELNLCETERGPMMIRLARWKEAYIAEMAKTPKNFPLYNSSNLTIPLIKETVHTLVGQLVQSTTQTRPRAILKDLAPEWEPYQDRLEKFLDLAAERDMGYEEGCVQAIIESAILGTSITEEPYEVDERHIYRYTAGGDKTYPDTVILHDGPKIRHIPIASFWIRNHEREPDTARWCAKRLLLSEMELREREANGKFYGIDQLIEWYAKPKEEGEVSDASFQGELPDRVHQKEDELLEQREFLPSQIEIFEIFLSFDIDDDKRYEELVLYYHRPSQMFVGSIFLPYWEGKRGFQKWGYFPRTDRFWDEGIAEMLEQIQIAVSAIANRRADNATLANLKMILKRKILKNLQPGDPLYSGKIIEVNDIYNDVREFSMSEIYPSTINEEQLLRQVGDRLSGINEATTGSAMPVTRTTAAAQMALLQEQRNRIGLTISKIRKAQQQIMQTAFWRYNQFGTNNKGLLWFGERGRVIDVIFRMPRRLKELVQAIEINTPSSTQNSQVKRENSIAVFNLLVQLYREILPLVQALSPNILPVVVQSMVKGARKYMGDVLESFDTSDPDAVLEGLLVLERVLPAPENLGGVESFDQRASSAQEIDALSRVEGLLREVEATRDGEHRTSAGGGERPRRTAPPEGNGRGDTSGLLFGGESFFQRR
jgi:hypothetical protein